MVRTVTKQIVSKVLYGGFFLVLLPASLFLWTSRLDELVSLPVPSLLPAGVIGVVLGGVLVVKGMLDLLILGKGLPMNAFPPRRLVTGGIYAWFSHPIYLGAALLSVGSSLWSHSASGLYIVTPVLVLAMVSLVHGYERPAMLTRFGEPALRYRPVLSVPAVGSWRRISVTGSMFVLMEIYWSALFYLSDSHAVEHLFLYAPASVLMLLLAFEYGPIWNALRRGAERVANSRRDLLLFNGRFRITNHSIYSGLAGAVGAGVFGYVAGSYQAVLILAVCAMLGAAGFAQLWWGSSSLLRPFGYWGAVAGGTIGILIAGAIFDVPISQAAVAGALCAPFGQAIGRLRCLTQGCCHGTPTRKELGIRVWQPQSRVVILSGLKGEYILPTQLFSILFNLPLGVLLLAVWSSQRFSGTFIVGLYLLLTGVERFTEDAYRGEKQTRTAVRLKENQWVAIAAVIAGVITTTLPAAPTEASGEFGLALWATALASGLITSFAMSMDFPRSRARFSRLSG